MSQSRPWTVLECCIGAFANLRANDPPVADAEYGSNHSGSQAAGDKPSAMYVTASFQP